MPSRRAALRGATGADAAARRPPVGDHDLDRGSDRDVIMRALVACGAKAALA
jgi:hypothetical protein